MRDNEPWGVGDWAKALAASVAFAWYGHVVVIFANRSLLRAGLGRDIGWLPNARDIGLALVVVFGWEHIGTLLHELGHAAMAWATGEGVRGLEVGRGRRRWHGHVQVGSSRVCLTLRAHAGPGHTVVRRRIPGRSTWVAAGGPIADLLGLILIGVPVALTVVGASTPGLSWGLELLALTALSQGRHLWYNAVPRLHDGRYNDGAKIFSRAGRASQVPTGPSPYDVWKDVLRRSDAGDPSAAIRMAEEMLARVEAGTKAHAEGRVLLAWQLGRAGRFREAVEQITASESHPSGGHLTAKVLDTAVADLVLSDAVVQGTALDAEQLTRLATVIDPDQEPAVRHTYALWLLASGQAPAAAAEAQRALREADALEPVGRAAVCATVTIALATAGDLSQARTWYDEVPAWSPWRSAAARSLGL